MSDSDEHLAPVTPLFGAGRAKGAPAAGGDFAREPREGEAGTSSVPLRPGWTNEGESGWAEPGTVAPDEPGWAPPGESGWGESAVRDSGPSDEPEQSGAGASASVGPDGAARPVPVKNGDDAIVSALPTYAAFAARTEGEAADKAHGQGFDADDAQPEPEPEETHDAAKARAENISLHALSRRGVSSAEMAKTLRSRDLPDDVVADEIERLERVGLLNDDELAENLVRSKQDRKGLGKGAITAELRQRGVAQESIDAAIADIDDDEEQARADDWATKRAGQLRGLDQATAERRLNGYLMRRGYRSEVIRRAVEKALPRGGGSRGGVRFE